MGLFDNAPVFANNNKVAPKPQAPQKSGLFSNAPVFAKTQTPVASAKAPVYMPKAGVPSPQTIGNAVKIGENKYKTLSGTTWDIQPDGTRVIHLAAQFGGGSYTIDPNNTSKLIGSTQDRQDTRGYGTYQSTSGQNRDHIIPVSLGGVSDNTNIRPVQKSDNPATFETEIARKVNNGQMSLAAGRLAVMTYKQNAFTSGTPKLNPLEAFAQNVADEVNKHIQQGITKKSPAFGESKPGVSAPTNVSAEQFQKAVIQSTLKSQGDQSVRISQGAEGKDLTGSISSIIRAPIRGLVSITNPSNTLEPLEQKYPNAFRFIYGDSPVVGYSRQAVDTEKQLQDAGFGKLSTPLAVIAATGTAAMDLAPLYTPLISTINEEIAIHAQRMGTKQVTITFKDLQDISSGKLTSGEKYDAFKNVSKDITDFNQAVKKGGVKVDITKDTFLQRATNPIQDIFQPRDTTYSANIPSPVIQPTVPTKLLQGDTTPGEQLNNLAKERAIKTVEAPVKPKTAPQEVVKPKAGQYQTIHDGGKIKVVDGTPTKIIDGVDTFLHKDENGNWVVSEATTGRNLSGGGFENSTFAVKAAKENINNVGVDKFKKLIADNQLKTTPKPKVVDPLHQEALTVMETPKITKAAKDVNLELVDRGFKALPESQLANYDAITKKATIEKVANFMNDIEKAKTAVIDTSQIPANFNNADKQVLFNSMKTFAEDTGDIKLLQKLANSPIATEQALAAQTLGASGYNKPTDDFVAKLQAINKAREVKTVTKKDVIVKRLKKAVKENNLTPEEKSINKFLEGIAC